MLRYQDFNFDTISTIFWKYRYQYFKNDKYVNFVQAQKQDVNVQQDSLFYVDTKMCQWTYKLTIDCRQCRLIE